MPTQKRQIFNILLWSFFVLLFGGLQTTLWPYVFGASPSPQLWLVVAIYLILYRSFAVSFFYNYFIGFLISSYTASPLGLLLAALGLLTLCVGYVKKGFFWPNTRYFVIATFFSVILFQVFYVALSHLREANPAELMLGQRSLEIVLTTLFSIPVYWLMKALDRITLEEKITQVKESVSE